MKRRKTLVVGAGASQPFGLPTGAELRNALVDVLWRNAHPIYKRLREAGFDDRTILELQKLLKHGAWWSVDALLAARSEYRAVGKAAIACVLLNREYFADPYPPSAPNGHWYQLLANCIADSDPGWRATHVVTFNYDRTLEWYLYRTLEARLGSLAKARAALNRFKIIHVHGKLGPETQRPDRHVRDYSAPPSVQSIHAAVKSIKVIDEAARTSAEFQSARAAIESSDSVVFLGFGFHDENMKRLGFPRRKNARRLRVYATHRGIDRSRWQQIQHKWFPFEEVCARAAAPERVLAIEGV